MKIKDDKGEIQDTQDFCEHTAKTLFVERERRKKAIVKGKIIFWGIKYTRAIINIEIMDF